MTRENRSRKLNGSFDLELLLGFKWSSVNCNQTRAKVTKGEVNISHKMYWETKANNNLEI
jgi:hypothetical protein